MKCHNVKHFLEKNEKKSKVFILQVLPIESVEFILFSHAKFL